MKKNIIIITILSLVTIVGTLLSSNISSAKNGKSSNLINVFAGQNLRKTELYIDGMWCASCATGAEYNLRAIEGVVDAGVGFTDDLGGQGWVIYEKGKVSEEQIIKAVEPYKTTVVSDVAYEENK